MNTFEMDYWNWYKNKSLSLEIENCECSNKKSKSHVSGEVCGNCGKTQL